MHATNIAAVSFLLMVQGCVTYTVPPVYYPGGGAYPQRVAPVNPPPPNNRSIRFAPTPPVIARREESRQMQIGTGGFNAVSFFRMTVDIESTLNQPIRIATTASGGYRNDFVTGWMVMVPATGARCLALRADLLGIEVLRQGLELPTALPGQGETATSKIPTTIEPGFSVMVSAIFGCSAPIQSGQLTSGQFQVLIGKGGAWAPEQFVFKDVKIN